MSENDIVKELEAVLSERIRDGQSTPVPWLKHAILDRHKQIEGQDKDWYLFCASLTLSDCIRKLLKKMKTGESECDQQLRLPYPGYDYLQSGYIVVRKKVNIVIPTDQCAIEELQQKIVQYAAIRDGMELHIQDLQRYIAARLAMGETQVAL